MSERQDLASKIEEGREVIAALMQRHAAMGRKIADASAALKQLERRYAELSPDRFDWTQERANRAPEPFRPGAFLKCVVVMGEHNMVTSRSRDGYLTCTRCRLRRRA
ncbi:MAG TPA: hypothetical protein VF138_07490 [Caulobacteraceae bacterium]